MSRAALAGPAAIVAAALALVGWSSAPSAGRATGAAADSDCHKGAPPLLHDGFPEPPTLYSRHGTLDVTLHASVSEAKFGRGHVRTMNYDGSVPAPTLAICAGDHLTVHLQNDLDEPTNLHTHGFHVSPSENHDNIFLRIEPHQAFTYEYDIPDDQPPGAYWYHPHLHMYVERQVYAGMAGAIVQEGGIDRLPALRHVPQRWIVLQNIEQRGGEIVPVGSSTEAADRLYVNGVLDPVARIRPGQLQRWRIFNASSDRLIDLRLPGHQRFMVLGEDGRSLERPRFVRDLLIVPGGRRDVLLRGGRHGRSVVRAIPFEQFPGAKHASTGGPTPNQAVITLRSAGRRAHTAYPRGVLNHVPDLRGRHVDRERTIAFSEMSEPSGAPLFALNGMTFDPNRTDVVMKLDSVERWTLVNQTAEWHTFHIHVNDFQVVSVAGKPIHYVDYEDNLALPPRSSSVILINPTDFTGRFVFHCHITFHEDHGMMATVEVVHELPASQARRSVVQDGGFAIASSAYGSRGTPAVRAPRFWCTPRHTGAVGRRVA